ncbi:hypothetical protein EST38_g5043 [Candolleomyces aberdarensis]|uniref:F-box domain-containing protein n=1 Tax=Candolleomyces aberdarensis TaxID=2316362 RepID=A0A4Q2DNC4_9AGAR|nr:hypothetical protein EST38_g5043 [Candolleomyces aberdarensis]
MLALRADTEPPIPQEISDITISFLKADRASLKNCGLVCRSWLLSSRCYLFQTIELDHSNIDTFSSLVVSTYSTIPPFVRRLKLAPGDRQGHRWFRRILPFLQFFKSVTWIALENLDWTWIKCPARSEFFSCFQSSLTELELKNLDFPMFRDVVDVVCESSSLVTISLTNISWTSGSPPLPLSSPASTDQSGSPRLPELKCPSLKKLIVRDCQIRPIFSWLLSHTSIPVIPSLEVGPISERDTMSFGRYLHSVNKGLLHLRMSFKTGGIDHACYADTRPIPNHSASEEPPIHDLTSQVVDQHQIDLEAAQKLYGPMEDELINLQGGTICDNLASLTGLRTLYLEAFIAHTDVERSSATVWAPRVVLSIKSLHLHTLTLDISLSRAGEVDAHPINWHLFDRILTEGRKERLKRVEVKYGGSIKHDAIKQLISSRWPVCQSTGKLHFISMGRSEAIGGRV